MDRKCMNPGQIDGQVVLQVYRRIPGFGPKVVFLLP